MSRSYLVFALVWAGAVAFWAGTPQRLIAAHVPPGGYYSGTVVHAGDTLTYISLFADGARGEWFLQNRMSDEVAPHGDFRPFFTVAGLLGRGLGLSPTATYQALVSACAFLFALTFALFARWLLGASPPAIAAAVLVPWVAGPLSLLPQHMTDTLGSMYSILPAANVVAETNTGRSLGAGGPLFSFSLTLLVLLFWSWGAALKGRRWALAALALVSLALGFTHPYDMPPLLLLAAAALVLPWERETAARMRIAATVLLLTAAPPVAYRAWLLTTQPTLAAYYEQVFLNSPNPYTFVIALVPFLFFVPWAARLATPAHRPLVRLLLLWMIMIAVCLYLPMRIQRRMVEGLHWAVVLCGIMGAMWLWQSKRELLRDWRVRVLVGVVAVFFAAALVPNVLFPFRIADWAAESPSDYFMLKEEYSALRFTAEKLPPGSVIGGSRETGACVAALTPHRAYLAHHHNTLDVRRKSEVMERILSGETSPLLREELLRTSPITHLVYGPREARPGGWDPSRDPSLVRVYPPAPGPVAIYRLSRAAATTP